MARGKGSQFHLNDYEQPLEAKDVERAAEVFKALLYAGPQARSLAPLLRELTEEQLSQVSIAAFAMYSKAQHYKTEKLQTRNRRNAARGGLTSGKSRALAS